MTRKIPDGRTELGMSVEEGLREALARQRGEIALPTHRIETTPLDPAALIETVEDVAFLIEAVFEDADADAGHVAAILNTIARSRGLSAVAERTGLSRQALEAALAAASGGPQLDTLVRVMKALGLRLTAPNA